MSATDEGAGTKRHRILVLLPLVGFLALAALFFYRLGTGDPSRLPSALIGHPAPTIDLPAVPGLERDGKAVPGVSNATFQGERFSMSGHRGACPATTKHRSSSNWPRTSVSNLSA
jgi:cytochrome c biogenesis protein CcmG/thiol:disulfide interchange protein DsbE